MATRSQDRAIKNYRSRLVARGMTRFEVLGLAGDRELIRALAKRLAEGGKEAAGIRDNVRRAVTATPSKKGGILEALRRSPLVGVDLNIERPRGEGRKVEL